MEFVKDDRRLEFISMLQTDTVWNDQRTSYKIEDKLFKSYPENTSFTTATVTNDSIIVKRSPFQTSLMSGAILLGFSTKAIDAAKQKIRATSLLVNWIVFVIGILMGFWLSKTISGPVLALRNAAIRVGKGDFDQRVDSKAGGEIGDLGNHLMKW